MRVYFDAPKLHWRLSHADSKLVQEINNPRGLQIIQEQDGSCSVSREEFEAAIAAVAWRDLNIDITPEASHLVERQKFQ